MSTNPASAPAIVTTLAELHRASGANMGVWFGCALPNDFGDWLAEYRFARTSVALIDKSYRAYFSFTGPDRVRYLNAILTNNIKDLLNDRGVVSLLLNPQGHILAEIETYAQPDRLLCVSYAMIRERLLAWLDKYIIMDDVTMSDQTQRHATLGLEGPRATEVAQAVAGVDLAQLEELASANVEVRSARPPNAAHTAVAAIPCCIVKRSPGAIPGAEFTVERQHLELLWSILSQATHSHGGGPVGFTALNALRLELGAPWFGYDFGEKQIPHEAGLQDSHISYSKGCYTGQEIVERVRSRGHANRKRVVVQFSGVSAPAPGAALTAAGKEVGHITRVAFSPALNATIGMAYARREHSAAGSDLQCANGAARVIVMPVTPEMGTASSIL
jgi:folate-binding protein YgfZ